MTVSHNSLDVLIPHFNDVEGLELSLMSVQKQVWPYTIRVVIADDGSSKEVYRKLEALVGTYPFEIVLIRNVQNRGRPYTRNVLLSHIDSSLVTWLDAGDEWFANKSMAQLEALDNYSQSVKGLCWATCNYNWKWKDKKPILCNQMVDGDPINSLLSGKKLRAYLWTIMAPAETFREVGFFDEKLPRLQDLDYFLRFISLGGKLVKPNNNEPLCTYHKSDLGRDARQIRDCNHYIFKKHYSLYFQYGEQFIKSRKYDMDLLSARYALNNKKHILAFYYLSNALYRRPRTLLKRVSRGGFHL